jgi:hypothetical protein
MTAHVIGLNHKPFADGSEVIWRRIVWPWWLNRSPMGLLAAPSAWGVGAFAHSGGLPLPVAVLAGLAFEAGYIGAIALADQQGETEDTGTTVLWWLVNLFAVIASIGSNLLFFSGGTYAAVTPEIATHAIPVPILGFMYGLLLHRINTQYARRVLKEKKESEARLKYRCRFCDAKDPSHRGFISDAAMRGHLANCPNKPKN